MNFFTVIFFLRSVAQKLVTNYLNSSQGELENLRQRKQNLHREVISKDTKYSLLLKLYMPSAFSVRTIQQCSIPTLSF